MGLFVIRGLAAFGHDVVAVVAYFKPRKRFTARIQRRVVGPVRQQKQKKDADADQSDKQTCAE